MIFLNPQCVVCHKFIDKSDCKSYFQEFEKCRVTNCVCKSCALETHDRWIENGWAVND